jgi:intein-encoded DNA endonuclease-like protein
MDKYLSLTPTYELLLYVQELLKRFGVETTGPWLIAKQGTPFYDPLRGKVYKHKKDVYIIYVRKRNNYEFYKYIGFTIRRKQERLEKWEVCGGGRLKSHPPLSPFLHTNLSMRLWALVL